MENKVPYNALTLELNANMVKDDPPLKVLGGGIALITPPLDESYWLARVKVSENQAVVAFPKFGLIGIGFQHEDEDWNTNLPSKVPAEEIFDHIKENSRGADRATCVAAIELLRSWANAQ